MSQEHNQLKEALLVLFQVLDLPQGAVQSTHGETPCFCTKQSREEQAICERRELAAFLEGFDFSNSLLLTLEDRLVLEFFTLDQRLYVKYCFAGDDYRKEDLDFYLSKSLQKSSAAGQLLYDESKGELSLLFAMDLEKLDPFFLAIWLPLFIDSIAMYQRSFSEGKPSSEMRPFEECERPAAKTQLGLLEEGEQSDER